MILHIKIHYHFNHFQESASFKLVVQIPFFKKNNAKNASWSSLRTSGFLSDNATFERCINSYSRAFFGNVMTY